MACHASRTPSRMSGTFCQRVKEPTISTVFGASVCPSGRRQRKILVKLCFFSASSARRNGDGEDGSRKVGPPFCGGFLLKKLPKVSNILMRGASYRSYGSRTIARFQVLPQL